MLGRSMVNITTSPAVLAQFSYRLYLVVSKLIIKNAKSSNIVVTHNYDYTSGCNTLGMSSASAIFGYFDFVV
eukprot:4677317-Amphidinium_carterae.2